MLKIIIWTIVAIVAVGHFYLMRSENDYSEFVIGIKGMVREYTVRSKTQREMLELAKPICDKKATRDTPLWNDCLKEQRYEIIMNILNQEVAEYMGERIKKDFYLSKCLKKKEIVKYNNGTTKNAVDFVECRWNR